MTQRVKSSVITESGADGAILIGGKYYLNYTSAINKLLDVGEDSFFEHRMLSWPEYSKKYPEKSEMDWAEDSRDSLVPGLLYFYDQVAPGHAWDIKLNDNWNDRFEEAGVNAKYYSQQLPFAYDGAVYTAENLGNLTYGYFGSAMGYTDELLYWAGGIPNIGIRNLDNLFKPYFGENYDSDTKYVKKGIDLFYNRYGNMYPATV